MTDKAASRTAHRGLSLLNYVQNVQAVQIVQNVWNHWNLWNDWNRQTFYPNNKLAWGPGVEPGFSDPESDVLPIRRSPNAKSPSRSMPTGALYPEGRPQPAFYISEGGLHVLLLDEVHLQLE
jgi:hypothetical protein